MRRSEELAELTRLREENERLQKALDSDKAGMYAAGLEQEVEIKRLKADLATERAKVAKLHQNIDVLLENLEAMENLLAPGSLSPTKLNRGKSHCIRGHLLAGDNLVKYRRHRICRTCAGFVGLEADLHNEMCATERLHLRVQIRDLEKHECNFSTGIDGSITAGTGDLDANGYWSKPCELCTVWANKCEQARELGREERDADVVHYARCAVHAPECKRCAAIWNGLPLDAISSQGSDKP